MTSEDAVLMWKDPERRSSDLDHPAGEITLNYVGGDEVLPTEWCSQFPCSFDCTWDCSALQCPGTWEPQCQVSIIYQ